MFYYNVKHAVDFPPTLNSDKSLLKQAEMGGAMKYAAFQYQNSRPPVLTSSISSYSRGKYQVTKFGYW